MGNQVVARFRDGRLLKGLTLNFDPEADHFHVVDPDHRYEEGVRVRYDELKALFFVKTFEGRREYEERDDFENLREYGRRTRVEFEDGEEILGVVLNPGRHERGFFLYPADPDANNERIFAIRDAVERIEYLDEPPAPPPED